MKIVVIQGPNINLLGVREPNIYGGMKMEDIHAQMKVVAEQNKIDIEFFQSNLEGELVDRVQECIGDADGIIINPAAYTHSSVAIRDAIAAANLPVIEVHISNLARREEFRQKSIIEPLTAGKISGFGPVGYHLAIVAMLQIFEQIKISRAAKQKQTKDDE